MVLLIIIIITIRAVIAEKVWKTCTSVRRPQQHKTNPKRERRGKKNGVMPLRPIKALALILKPVCHMLLNTGWENLSMKVLRYCEVLQQGEAYVYRWATKAFSFPIPTYWYALKNTIKTSIQIISPITQNIIVMRKTNLVNCFQFINILLYTSIAFLHHRG